MKQGGSGTATILPESNIGPTLSVVELPQYREEVDSKLDQAREHLLALRRQQEELERQKGELEELRRKQEEYSRGRAEITDNLARGLLVLERQQNESQRLAELSGTTIAAFRDYAEQIQQINDGDWNSGNVRSELTGRSASLKPHASNTTVPARSSIASIRQPAKTTRPTRRGQRGSRSVRVKSSVTPASAPLLRRH